MITRPPKRSVQMPSGRRNTAPVKTGVAVRRPTWVGSRLSCARIGMPVTPNIVHTAKQAVKAQVVTNRTVRFPDFGILAPVSHADVVELADRLIVQPCQLPHIVQEPGHGLQA